MAPPRGRDGSRRAGLLVASLAVVALVAGLAIALNGLGGAPPTSTSGADASTAAGDLYARSHPRDGDHGCANRNWPECQSDRRRASNWYSFIVSGQGTRAVRIKIERLDIDLRIVDGDGH